MGCLLSLRISYGAGYARPTLSLLAAQSQVRGLQSSSEKLDVQITRRMDGANAYIDRRISSVPRFAEISMSFKVLLTFAKCRGEAVCMTASKGVSDWTALSNAP